jgi:hypothetical protein
MEPLLAIPPLVFAVFPSGRYAVISSAVLAFHIFISGKPRFQLYPLYLLSYGPGLVDCVTRYGLTSIVPPQSVVIASVIFGIVLSFVLDRYIMPSTLRLLGPSGPHRPARLTIAQLRRNRASVSVNADMPTEKPRDKKHKAPKLPYLQYPFSTTGGIAKGLGISSNITRWFAQVPSVVADADPEDTPVVGGKHPVAVFSHADGMVPEVYSALLDDLVSHGWVVFAVTHSDGSAAYTRQADGYTRSFDPVGKVVTKEQYKIAHTRLKERVRELGAVVELIHEIAGVNKKKRDGDDEEEEERDENPPDDELLTREMLKGRIDVNSIVAIGDGVGAATVAALCEKDKRIAAACLLDFDPSSLSSATFTRMPHIPTLAVATDSGMASPMCVAGMKLLVKADERAKHVRTSIVGEAEGCGITLQGEVSPRLTLESADVHRSSALVRMHGLRRANVSDAAILLGRLGKWLGVAGSADAVDAARALRNLVRLFIEKSHTREWIKDLPSGVEVVL